jgi:hypothetical protein
MLIFVQVVGVVTEVEVEVAVTWAIRVIVIIEIVISAPVAVDTITDHGYVPNSTLSILILT